MARIPADGLLVKAKLPDAKLLWWLARPAVTEVGIDSPLGWPRE